MEARAGKLLVAAGAEGDASEPDGGCAEERRGEEGSGQVNGAGRLGRGDEVEKAGGQRGPAQGSGKQGAAGYDRKNEQPESSPCGREGRRLHGHAAEGEEAEHQRESTEAAGKDRAWQVELGVEQQDADDDSEESGVRRGEQRGEGGTHCTFWPRDCSACRMPSAAESLGSMRRAFWTSMTEAATSPF